MSNNIIIVNATALDSSGALTILKQFLYYASKSNRDFLCFISNNIIVPDYDNISYVRVDKKSWYKRILWDCFELKKYLKESDINTNLFISLQNTTANLPKKIKQIVYLHQPLPFSDFKWNPFKKEQFRFFLYKYFYLFFIKLFVADDTEFVVQTKWIKDRLLERLNINASQVNIFRPDIVIPNFGNNKKERNDEFIFIYPATPLFYKNHITIINAFKKLVDSKLLTNFRLKLTIPFNKDCSIVALIMKYELSDYIDFIGVVSYDEMIDNYAKADVLLFPSFIETFGLPLAEFAYFGKKIIASDLPYAKEVLEGYDNISFVCYNDPEKWANEILSIYNDENLEYCSNFKVKNKSGWCEFIKYIEEK